jgi:methionyl-tRNA formyltransferase
VAAGHDIVLVLTQPDRPAGRGLHAAQSAVKRYAVARHIPVIQPLRLKDTPEIEQVRTAGVDALVVAAYGLLLPQPLLEAGRHGALNIHASLLPRWRGAAPIQRALLAGDAETGVSIMQMEAGLDTGPVLRQQRLPIAPDADAATLHDALAALGATEIVAALADLDAGRARAVPQPARRRYVRSQNREARNAPRLVASGARARARGARVPACTGGVCAAGRRAGEDLARPRGGRQR